jgi:hypothetical protein
MPGLEPPHSENPRAQSPQSDQDVYLPLLLTIKNIDEVRVFGRHGSRPGSALGFHRLLLMISTSLALLRSHRLCDNRKRSRRKRAIRPVSGLLSERAFSNNPSIRLHALETAAWFAWEDMAAPTAPAGEAVDMSSTGKPPTDDHGQRSAVKASPPSPGLWTSIASFTVRIKNIPSAVTKCPFDLTIKYLSSDLKATGLLLIGSPQSV